MNKKIKTLKGISSGDYDYISLITVCAAIFAVLFAMYTFTGKWPWTSGNPYNSYIIQAQAWLSGHLSVPAEYDGHWNGGALELAKFNDKFYVSFPPFPSYVMLPFVAFGWLKCDGVLNMAFAIAAGAYAFKIAEHFGIKKERGIILALLLTIGSNWLFNAQVPWVWFIAQNMAFTLSLMAVYYALKGKAGLSLAFWACAVGCRPMQVLYIFVLIYLFYDKYKTDNPDITIVEIIKTKWTCLIPMAVIALSYMILNAARFGSITEFGHNYLPEFAEKQQSPYGQFSVHYMSENIKTLFRLPENHTFKNAWEYQGFNGTNIFLISPVLIAYIAYMARAVIKKEKKNIALYAGIFVIMVLHVLMITAHKTMGGLHFGNRYINDILPFAYLAIALSLKDRSRFEGINTVLLFMGAAVNIIGIALYFV